MVKIDWVMPSTNFFWPSVVVVESKKNELQSIWMMVDEISSIEISFSFVLDHRSRTRIEKIEAMFDDSSCFEYGRKKKVVLINDSIAVEEKVHLNFESDVGERVGLSCSIEMCNDCESISEELTPRTIIRWWTQTLNIIVF